MTIQTSKPSPAPVSRFGELTTLLTDNRHDRSTRLLRLQGWRGIDLDAAHRSGAAARLGPVFCAAGSLAVAATASVPVLAVLWLTAVIGTFAANHPVETGYNLVAGRIGRHPLPRNRAAKRLACLLGVLFLGASLLAFSAGSPAAGRIIAGVMGAVAAFVAVTGICVPSVVFTLLWGTRRAMAPSLVAAARSN